MKKQLLIILLVTNIATIWAQDHWHNYPECYNPYQLQAETRFQREAKEFVYNVALVSCQAAGDALLYYGLDKEWGHILKDAGHAMMLISPVYHAWDINFKSADWDDLKPFLLSTVKYIGYRIVFFDIVHNLVGGQQWNYIGTTSTWDHVRGRFNSSPDGMIWFRGLVLVATVAISF